MITQSMIAYVNLTKYVVEFQSKIALRDVVALKRGHAHE